MDNYLVHFLTPTLVWSVGLTALVAAVATWTSRRRLGSRLRQMQFFALVISVGLILSATLLREFPREVCWGCLAGPAVWGDWGLQRLIDGALTTEVRFNVALFMPFGLSATLLWKAPFRATGAAALLSGAIELIQPLLGAGTNDMLDIASNTLGAFLGAGTAVLIRLTWDTATKRQFDRRRWARFLAVVAITVTTALGGSAWGASSRQLAGARQLDAMFEGTTLDDHQRDHDSAWLPTRETFWKAHRMPFSDSYADKTVALDRYTWEFYLATRCVTARWEDHSFSTVLGSGDQCTQRLAARRTP
ncbi:MAG: VanZ family protein [Propionibacteriaceae bacterium]|nr:VanZ family protein [Propionibacteriaceae bacterium]